MLMMETNTSSLVVDWSAKDKTSLGKLLIIEFDSLLLTFNNSDLIDPIKGEELSDVLAYLVRLADRCHVDLASAYQAKMKKNAVKYPAKLVWMRVPIAMFTLSIWQVMN